MVTRLMSKQIGDELALSVGAAFNHFVGVLSLVGRQRTARMSRTQPMIELSGVRSS